jgi:predicted CDP-diglyceride synthetase/phosphatidate cytidylyltransferase
MHPNHLNEGGMKCSFLIAHKYGSYFLALIIMHVKDFFISLGYHVEFAYSHICSCNWWVLYIIFVDLGIVLFLCASLCLIKYHQCLDVYDGFKISHFVN